MGLQRMSLMRCCLYMLILTGIFVIVMKFREVDIRFTILEDSRNEVLPLLTAMKRPWKTTNSTNSTDSTDSTDSTNSTDSTDSTGTTTNVEKSSEVSSDPANRPWYFQGGTRLPHPARRSRGTGRRMAWLWPEEETTNDRIENQLMFVPPDYNKTDAERNLKKIMVMGDMGEGEGRQVFQWLGCPVDTCTITHNNPGEADLVLFKGYTRKISPRPRNQIWMINFLESPYHTQSLKGIEINWTATYRWDSDIVTPYDRWQYHDPRVTQMSQPINYAANKTKKVAWFVSNCNEKNNRQRYAKELGEYISVDIYGACGTLHCPRSKAQTCFDMLDTDYKFYLAFENSNCKDYITEKFFKNGLQHNVLPIVMGARPSDYARSAPHHSYIHVDEFESPKELAAYLHLLDNDDELYNSYFAWKGTGEYVNSGFFCRVCAMLHDEHQERFYKNVDEWWRGDGVCTKTSWREHDAQVNVIRDERVGDESQP